MKNRLEIDSANYIDFYRIEWDSKLFNQEVLEISEIIYSNAENLNNLLYKFIVKNPKAIINIRIDSNDNSLKFNLQKTGFFYTETLCEYFINNLQNKNIKPIKKVNIEKVNNSDFEDIKQVLDSSFNYSRYHENIQIDSNLAKKRYTNWIDEIQKSGSSEILVYKQKLKVVSFVIYYLIDNSLNLQLGGSKAGSGFITPIFWSNILFYFQQKGIKQVKTYVSAANIGSMKLHYKNHFDLNKTLIGFTKIPN